MRRRDRPPGRYVRATPFESVPSTRPLAPMQRQTDSNSRSVGRNFPLCYRIALPPEAFTFGTNPSKRSRTMAEHSEAISTLNTLIATTIDSITGYEDSAQNIDNERFREIFRQRASERQQVVEQLRAEVRRLGGDPEDSGSFLGKAHQRFEDLKGAMTGRHEKSIINEVDRGAAYLNSTLHAALHSGD